MRKLPFLPLLLSALFVVLPVFAFAEDVGEFDISGGRDFTPKEKAAIQSSIALLKTEKIQPVDGKNPGELAERLLDANGSDGKKRLRTGKLKITVTVGGQTVSSEEAMPPGSAVTYGDKDGDSIINVGLISESGIDPGDFTQQLVVASVLYHEMWHYAQHNRPGGRKANTAAKLNWLERCWPELAEVEGHYEQAKMLLELKIARQEKLGSGKVGPAEREKLTKEVGILDRYLKNLLDDYFENAMPSKIETVGGELTATETKTIEGTLAPRQSRATKKMWAVFKDIDEAKTFNPKTNKFDGPPEYPPGSLKNAKRKLEILLLYKNDIRHLESELGSLSGGKPLAVKDALAKKGEELEKRKQDKGQGRVGPQGGAVALKRGPTVIANLQVPATALTQTGIVKLSTIKARGSLARSPFALVYAEAPSNKSFNKPIKLTVNYSALLGRAPSGVKPALFSLDEKFIDLASGSKYAVSPWRKTTGEITGTTLFLVTYDRGYALPPLGWVWRPGAPSAPCQSVPRDNMTNVFSTDGVVVTASKEACEQLRTAVSSCPAASESKKPSAL